MLIAVLARPVDSANESRREVGSRSSSPVSSHNAFEITRKPVRCLGCPAPAIVNGERRLCAPVIAGGTI